MVPTEIGSWQLRSSGAHWGRTLALEVQQCPLSSEIDEEEEEEDEEEVEEKEEPEQVW